jgi:hypothetical protein
MKMCIRERIIRALLAGLFFAMAIPDLVSNLSTGKSNKKGGY